MRPATRRQPCRGAASRASRSGLYFVLGFMTKFVAAIFLPMIIGAGGARCSAHRGHGSFASGASGPASARCAPCSSLPWFAYATVRFGAYFWEVILTQHVYTRFRTFLNPVHVQPWSYYPTEMFLRFGDSGSQWLVADWPGPPRRPVDSPPVVRRDRRRAVVRAAGHADLLRHVEALSLRVSVSSAAGARGRLSRGARRDARAGRRSSRALQRVSRTASRSACRRPSGGRDARAVRAVLLAVAGGRRGRGGGQRDLRADSARAWATRCSSRARAWSVRASCCCCSACWPAPDGAPARIVVALLVTQRAAASGVSRSPAAPDARAAPDAERDRLSRRASSRRLGDQGSGLYVDVPGEFISHPLYYYFRRVRPWTRAAVARPGRDRPHRSTIRRSGDRCWCGIRPIRTS